MVGYCSCWYRSASSLVFQKLIARTRFGSVSDTKRVSSANPVCLFRIGSTLSLMRVVSSRAVPDLVVSSTTLVYMGSTPFGGIPAEWQHRTPVLCRGQLPFGAVLGLSSQALFLEVITEETDQHCSTLWLPQRGQTTPPSS